jgi:hypothetical protein
MSTVQPGTTVAGGTGLVKRNGLARKKAPNEKNASGTSKARPTAAAGVGLLDMNPCSLTSGSKNDRLDAEGYEGVYDQIRYTDNILSLCRFGQGVRFVGRIQIRFNTS